MRRSSRSGQVVLDLLLMVSLCATMVAAVSYARRLSGAQVLVEDLSVSASLARAQDRLIGRRLALSADSGHAVGKSWISTRRTVLWILDGAKCTGCLSEITQWARLERLADLNFSILVVGEVSPSMEARLRTLGSTHVGTLTPDEAVRLIGDALGSTKLLLDPTGRVLLADSRSSGQECGWNFEAQLGALLGVLPAEEIRFAAASEIARSGGDSVPATPLLPGHR